MSLGEGQKKGRQMPALKEVQVECVEFRALPPGFDLGADLDVAINSFATACGLGFISEEGSSVSADNRARPVARAGLPLLGDGHFPEILGFGEPGAVGIAGADLDRGSADGGPVVERPGE